MRDVSLEQIARETKISLPILEALENDRFEALPSPAIVRGFLRAYAGIVGLSENALVLRYESILEERGLSPRGPAAVRQRVPRKPRRLAPVVWGLLLVLGLGVGLRLVDREGKAPESETAAGDGAGEIVYRKNYLQELSTDAPAGTPARYTAAGPEEAELPGGGIHLQLRALAPISVRVVLDGGESETISLDPGQPVARHAFRGALLETSRPDRLLLEANGRPVASGLTGSRAVRILLAPRAGDAAGEAPGGPEREALPEVAARVIPLVGGPDAAAAPPEPFFPD